MLKYLQRPGKPKPVEARTALKRGGSDTKGAAKNSKVMNYINDNLAMYQPDTASKEQLEGLEKRLANARAHVTPEKKKMSKQDEYDTYFNKNSPKYYSKEKSKPIDPHGFTPLNNLSLLLLLSQAKTTDKTASALFATVGVDSSLL